MKTIMIIGAGTAQVPLIKAAKKENYHTIVCDIDKNAPGVSLADEYCKVSTKDREGLYSIAKEKHIDGIVANSEYAMCDVAFISSELGLVGNPEEAIAVLSSKSRFRGLQKKAGLFAPDFYVAGEQAIPLSFPIIIKPDECSGTRGTTVIKNQQDTDFIDNSIDECSTLSRNGKVILEEYVTSLPGPTIEGEIFIHNGETIWDGLFSTMRSEQAPMLPMTYIFPCKEDEGRIAKLKDSLSRAFKTAGIIHGEFNIEFFFTENDKPFIIEINPRQGGNELPQYVQEYCGIDLYRLLVTTTVGDEEYCNKLGRTNQKHIIHHMLYPMAYKAFRGLQIDKSIQKYVYRIKIDMRPGDRLWKSTNGSESIGYIDLMFPDKAEQMEVCNRIEELIKIDTD